jgi:hypothetical protein
MAIRKMHTRALSPDERRELDAALADPQRFHSDGRPVLLFCTVLPALMLPLIAVLLAESRSLLQDGELDRLLEDMSTSILAPLYRAPELLGAFALALVSVALLAHGLRTWRRHGHAITSFGVVRIRGHALRVLRYEDIAGSRIIERGRPQHRVITTELELAARDGRTMSLFGFDVRARKALIDQHLLHLQQCRARS